MKKLITAIIGVLFVFSGFGQLAPGVSNRIATRATPLLVNIPVGTQIVTSDSGKLFMCVIAAIGSESIATAPTKFKEIASHFQRNTGVLSPLVGADYLSLGSTSAADQLQITNNFRMANTTGATVGIIKKGNDRFLHNYGTDNVFLGTLAGNTAMTGTGGNIGVGVQTLGFNETGYNNVAIGHKALYANTTGNKSTAIGFEALKAGTTASNNTAIGWGALTQSTGDYNTAIGSNLMANTSGTYNTAIGYSALGANTTQGYNVAVGPLALGNTSANYNTAIGYQAGRYATSNTPAEFNYSGNSSVYIGYTSKAFADNQTNEIVIGYNAVGAGSNTATLGNTSIANTILRGIINAAGTQTGTPQYTMGILASGDLIKYTNPSGGAGTVTGVTGTSPVMSNGHSVTPNIYIHGDSLVSWWLKQNKGSTAYGWGNHASAGYLTSQTSHADVLQDGDFTSQGIMLRGASSGVYSILTDNSSNWNTAYGWGNHASAGYVTGTPWAGLYFAKSDSNTNANPITLKYFNTYNAPFPGFGTSHSTSAYGDHTHSGYEPSFTKSTGYLTWNGSAWAWKNETYMQTSHPANGITSQNMIDWTLSGGIYYTFGALNGLIKGDGNYGYTAVTDNSGNWNTSYGWGNHASAGYLTSQYWTVAGSEISNNTASIIKMNGLLKLDTTQGIKTSAFGSIYDGGFVGDWHIRKYRNATNYVSLDIAHAGTGSGNSFSTSVFGAILQSSYEQTRGSFLWTLGNTTTSLNFYELSINGLYPDSSRANLGTPTDPWGTLHLRDTAIVGERVGIRKMQPLEALHVGGKVMIDTILTAASQPQYVLTYGTGGRVEKYTFPSGGSNYWSQSSGKISPATPTDDIVATDSLRSEGPALIKSNLTVQGIIEAQDSISVWHGVYNYRSLLTLDDDVSIAFEAMGSGHGTISSADGLVYATFYFSVTGAVIVCPTKTEYIAEADTDTFFCLYWDSAFTIKNRLGYTNTFIINIEYQLAI